jgi:hypothetical protein
MEMEARREFAARIPMKVADEFLLARRLHPPPALGDADPRQARHPFAGDWGYELCILPGDRVVLTSAIAVEPEDGAASYRDPLRTRKVAAGVPRVQIGA